MSNMMEFPKTLLEFVESYKFKDSDEIYTNGSELIQVFRVKQMLEHYYEPLKENVTPKKPNEIKECISLLNDTFKWGSCVSCGERVTIYEKYCKKCGQAIAWSNEE